jgi:hypothetical protein
LGGRLEAVVDDVEVRAEIVSVGTPLGGLEMP